MLSYIRLFLTFFVTWFFIGKISKAPGTLGSLLSIPFGWIIIIFYGPIILFIISIILFLLGIFTVHFYSKMIGHHDAKEIVIDEVVGQWLILIMLPISGVYIDFIWILLSLIIFRFFDIYKPSLIRWCDNFIPGAFGIMFDDIIASIFAMIILIIPRIILIIF